MLLCGVVEIEENQFNFFMLRIYILVFTCISVCIYFPTFYTSFGYEGYCSGQPSPSLRVIITNSGRDPHCVQTELLLL